MVIDSNRSVISAMPAGIAALDFVAGCALPFANIAGHHLIDHACTIRVTSTADAENHLQNRTPTFAELEQARGDRRKVGAGHLSKRRARDILAEDQEPGYSQMVGRWELFEPRRDRHQAKRGRIAPRLRLA
jgi:hypothetical protein